MMPPNHNLTRSDKTNTVNHDGRMAPLQADYQALLKAPPAAVFEAVADHDRYCQFIPNLQRTTLRQSEQGLIRVCDFGNDMILQERILEWQPPASYAYTALSPNPFGVWHHFALVTCEPHQAGTQLRWQHYFEHDDLSAMLSMLDRSFEQIFTGLFKQFEGRML